MLIADFTIKLLNPSKRPPQHEGSNENLVGTIKSPLLKNGEDVCILTVQNCSIVPSK
jgi:hypothetical protein